MQTALAPWHAPAAAAQIAENILRAIARKPEKTAPPVPPTVGRTRVPGPVKALL
jgi:hypothetical protein